MKLQQKTIIITGGASGLGAATAQTLSQAGAKVAILDRQGDAAERLAHSLDAWATTCDVTDENSVQTALTEAAAALGPIRACINCAGVAPAKRILGRDSIHPLADFKTVIDVNLIGTFNVLRLAASAMAEQKITDDEEDAGVIINTASVAAFEGQIGQAAYSASKGGVAAMTLPAARELANFKIRVMTIAPGLFATPMLTGMPQEVQDRLAATVTFPKRLGDPHEYAKLAQHIIENSMLNGAVIRLDGALRMQER